MLSRAARVSSVLAVAAGVTVSGTVLSTAAAGCGGGGIACTPDKPQSDGNTVVVSVYGDFVRGGSDGSPGGGSTSVSVPTPCKWYEGWTGKEYYEGIQSNEINGAGSRDADRGTWEPNAGYEKYKDDTKGHWYFPGCSMLDGMFDNYDEFTKYAQNYFDENPDVYVQPGETPPVPDVPPEVLLMAAQEAMEMPEPAFDYNPKRAADAATLVNLDTWFWQEDRAESGEVTAEAGGNSATVQARLGEVTYVGDNAGAVTCADAGTPWQPGAASDCVLQFIRAGSNTVTATSTWNLSWSYNGTPMGDLDALGATWSADVGVVESQALVTGVR